MPGPLLRHFWDWMLWLAAKHQAGKADLVAAELAKRHEHLLAPLSAPARLPRSARPSEVTGPPAAAGNNG